ncbi:MAG: DNA recombination protein RmuC [Arenimonas sp.]|nr:DNA recombination protein RmuC [Arenimonas sp.]
MTFTILNVVLITVLIILLIALIFFVIKKAALETKLFELNSQIIALQLQEQELFQVREQYAGLKAGSDAREQSASEQIQLLNSAEERLKENFENLAQKIFEDKSSKFKEQNKEQLDALLNPLKTQIGEFRQTVQHTNEGIHTLKELNARMADEATNLTRALKGDNKAQGGWGEQVLGRILEASGLTEGRDYQSQFTYVDEEKNRKQPDCVIFLPDNKAIVLDSKVSLIAYDRYISAENEQARELALKEHMRSVKAHIDGLSAKSYESLPNLRTTDFVVLFIPIEAAFIDAMRADDGLMVYALERNITLATPSTLITVCRTVAHLQKLDLRNANAMKIADQAGKLYDEFVSFATDLGEVGKHLNKALDAQSSAVKRLSVGRSNLVGQVEKMKLLGARAKKQLPADLLDDDSDDTPELRG